MANLLVSFLAAYACTGFFMAYLKCFVKFNGDIFAKPKGHTSFEHYKYIFFTGLFQPWNHHLGLWEKHDA